MVEVLSVIRLVRRMVSVSMLLKCHSSLVSGDSAFFQLQLTHLPSFGNIKRPAELFMGRDILCDESRR